MIRWVFKFEDGRSVLGGWGASRCECETMQIPMEGMVEASVEWLQDSVIRTIAKSPAQLFKKFSWVSIAKQYGACEHNVALVLEAEGNEIFCDAKTGKTFYRSI